MKSVVKNDIGEIKSQPVDGVWQRKKHQKYSITKKFQATSEFKQFEIWCDDNHMYAMKLLKKYCRYTVILDGDLSEVKIGSLKNV